MSLYLNDLSVLTRVADVVKALALVVCIGPMEVLMPGVAATKMDIGVTPHIR